MEQIEKKRFTLKEYLLLEEEHQQRFEFHDGEIFGMAGGDPKHSAIATNLLIAIGDSSKSKDDELRCRSFNSDLKIYIEAFNKILYPDMSVFCGERKRSERVSSAYINPVLVVEVLSESTAAYDRGDKFRYYMQLPSLQEYVLIEQDQQIVQTFYKIDKNRWAMELYDKPNAVISFHSIQAEIALEAVYFDVD